MPKQEFVQLDEQDCNYLLELIKDIDSDTPYTTRQRAYTVPKLEQIAENPSSRRLAFQDVDYLLELIEDDDLEETEQIRYMVQMKLEKIRVLQAEQARQLQDVETQRAQRRARRSPAGALQDHFERTSN